MKSLLVVSAIASFGLGVLITKKFGQKRIDLETVKRLKENQIAAVDTAYTDKKSSIISMEKVPLHVLQDHMRKLDEWYEEELSNIDSFFDEFLN